MMLLEHKAWPWAKGYFHADDRVLLVTGSCEQHGPHLPMGTDTLAPLAIARRVSERVGVPVAPAIPYGLSHHHMAFAGTVSLRPGTFVAIVTDVIESLYRHGMRRVMICNGHGGNAAPLTCALAETANAYPDLRVKVYTWWDNPEIEAVLRAEFGDREYHATVAETSLLLALAPELVVLDRATSSPPQPGIEFVRAVDWQVFYPSGAKGSDPRRSNATVGRRLLELATERGVQEIETWA